jgi:uncharacterized protein YqgC (DUF456 family)
LEQTLGYLVASAAFVLGGVAAFVPGFPGSAVALIGLVAFAGLTDFRIVDEYALLVGALVCLGSTLAQIASPAVASRAAGGTAGAASGAAIGAVLGALVPLPGAAFFGGVAGSVVLGVLFSREGVVNALRGMIGALGGCAVAIAVDLLAVLGIAAILAVAVFATRI